MGASVEQIDAHKDAKAVLEEHGLTIGTVLRVYPDCVLFVTKKGTAMTAWLTVTKANTNTGRTLKVEVEKGFLAERHRPIPLRRPNPTVPFPLNRNTQF